MSPRNNENGIALISVLLLLTAMGVMTAAAIAAGLYLGQDVSSYSKRAREYYRAESALNQAVYLLKLDVAAHPDRKLGEIDYSNRFQTERYLADGIERTAVLSDKSELPMKISDAAGHFSLQPFNTLTARLKARHEAQLVGKMADLDQEKRFQVLLSRISDFLDSDNFRDLDGMEGPEYLRAGKANLPRNGDPQFREEALWIPGMREFLPSPENGLLRGVQLVAPSGLSALPAGLRLYSSEQEEIGDELALTDQERKELADALEAWRTKRTLLNLSLDRTLYNKVTSNDKLSLRESGFYEIQIGDSSSPLRLTATLQLTGNGPAFLEFHEYIVH